MSSKVAAHRICISIAAIVVLLTLPAHCSLSAESDVTKGLLAYWSFDAGVGAYLTDESGNGLDGTIHGATWTTGIAGAALEFNGSGDHVDFGDVLRNEAADSRSYSLWLRVEPPFDSRFVLAKQNNQGSGRGFNLQVHESGSVVFTLISDQAGDLLQVIGNRTVIDDEWHHVVFTYDGSASAAGVGLWVDGSPCGLGVSDDSLTGICVGSESFRMGCREQCTFNRFEGCLDEVRIYDRVLSDQEVAALYTPQVDVAVTNVRIVPAPGDRGPVDIYYDLHATSGAATVSLQLSTDNGRTFPNECTALLGDHGANVPSGHDRHVVWDPEVDYPAYSGELCRVRVTAVDAAPVTRGHGVRSAGRVPDGKPDGRTRERR